MKFWYSFVYPVSVPEKKKLLYNVNNWSFNFVKKCVMTGTENYSIIIWLSYISSLKKMLK